MPFNPGNVRKVNALGGKRPQATGIVLIPKNNGNVLKTSNGSTANYGGNTKFGLYPNVGMSYLFQNKIGVGSLFYNTTTPSQVNPPQSNSQTQASHPGLVEETNNSITFTYPKSNTYGVSIVPDVGTSFTNPEAMITTSAALFFDSDLTNRELDDGRYSVFPTANNPFVESDMPVYIGFGYGIPTTLINVFIEVYDEDPTANYSVTWTQGNAFGGTNGETHNLVFNNHYLYNPTHHPPPIGLNGFYTHIFDLQTEGINYYEGDGGQDINGNLQLPVNFVNSNNLSPLKITITKN